MVRQNGAGLTKPRQTNLKQSHCSLPWIWAKNAKQIRNAESPLACRVPYVYDEGCHILEIFSIICAICHDFENVSN